jgi:uncharacterized membrane protein required for colicin V production
MGPIEGVFLAIATIFGFIGVVRGYSKELGNTIVIMYVIAVLGFLDDQVLDDLFAQIGSSIFGIDQATLNLFLFLCYTTVFVGIVFATYQGKTFDYGGQQRKGCLGVGLSLVVGLINGYLVAGTLWYYADKFKYPLSMFQVPLTVTNGQINGQMVSLFQEPLTQIGATIAKDFLPQTVFDGNPVYWALPATALLLLKIWK